MTIMNILIVSGSPYLTTGYSILGKYIFNGLRKKGFNVKYLNLFRYGVDKDPDVLPIGSDLYGSDVFEEHLVKYNIDLVITFIDIWTPQFSAIYEILKQYKQKGVLWCHHTTINSTLVPTILKERIDHADYLVAPSHWCKQVLIQSGYKPEIIKVIYHGVNTTNFKPYTNKARKKLRKRYHHNGKFIFLFVGANVGNQKNIPRLFKSFKDFLELSGARDAFLWIHTDPVPRGGEGLLLNLHATRYGFYNSDRIIYTPGYNKNAGFNEEKMCQLYNMCNVVVNCTMGESFSFPLIESLSCGIPVIYPDFSTPKEIIDLSNSGCTAKIRDFIETPYTGEQALVDTDDFAQKMLELYKNSKLREQMGKNGRKFAVKYKWKNIINEWADLLKEIENRIHQVDYWRNLPGF